MGRIQDYPQDSQLTGAEKVLATDADGSTVNITVDQIVDYRPTQDINDGSVTNAKLADAPADTLKGRLGTDGVPQDITPAQARNLLNVEDGATADQTGAEIKALYEAEANTNAFTDALKTKLEGIEGSKFLGTYVNLSALNTAHPTAAEGSYAHVDAGPGNNVTTYIWDNDDNQFVEQTGTGTSETPASIKSKYESNADTNAFTDALQTKLNGIETSATADQTPLEIKTAYESNSNTNAFTDALQTKLNGIEAGATADQSASEVPVSLSPTNYTTSAGNVEQHLVGINTALGSVVGGDTNNFNNTYADYTGSGLTGVQDGVNTQFTVSQSEYTSGTLMVALNGQIYWAGNGITETTPASGIFDLEAAPLVGDVIYARYQVGVNGGGSGTDDQNASEVPTIIQNGVTQSNVQLELEKLNINNRPFDSTPTTSSTNAVTSGGVKAALVDINSHVGLGNINVDKITNFNAQVSANPDVAANTAKVGITPTQAADIVANNAKVTNATHTGDVTGSGALTIANDVVTNSKLANMGINTIKGRITSGTGDPEDLTPAQVRTILNVADGATSVQLDSVPTNSSNNGVTSNGVFDALATKPNLASSNTFTGSSNINDFQGVLAINGKMQLFNIPSTNHVRSSLIGGNLYINGSGYGGDFVTFNGTSGKVFFAQDVEVSPEVYGPGWNGSNEVPTKNDLYDKIETLAAPTVATFTPTLTDGSGNAYTATLDHAIYIKSGRTVTINIEFSSVSGTGSGGGLEIRNLPALITPTYNGTNRNFIGGYIDSTSHNYFTFGVNGTIIQAYNSGGIPINVAFSNGYVRVSGTYICN